VQRLELLSLRARILDALCHRLLVSCVHPPGHPTSPFSNKQRRGDKNNRRTEILAMIAGDVLSRRPESSGRKDVLVRLLGGDPARKVSSDYLSVFCKKNYSAYILI
jgi:hypothetical protein